MKNVETQGKTKADLPQLKQENASAVCYMAEFPSYFGQDTDQQG